MTVLYQGPKQYVKVKNPSKRIADMIKYHIPDTHRYWEEGYWFVHGDYIQPVCNAIAKEGRVAYVAESLDPPAAYKNLHLLESAPLWLVEAVWRAFVKNNHPDVGGDEQRFKLVKESYELIKKVLG